MSGQILVPLKKHDRIEEILLYLDVLARPGMKVVFLTPYQEKVSWMEVQLIAMQTRTGAITTITALKAKASREAHMRWVEERIRPGRQTLEKKGTTVAVQCYNSSLQNALATFRDTDREMVVLLGERWNIIRKLTGQIGKLCGRFRTDNITPILFLRSRRQH